MEKIKEIKKSKKLIIAAKTAAAAILGFALIYFGFQFFSKSDFSFFWPFQKEKTQESQTGLPKTPKGRVGPSPEFLEKIKEAQDKTPAGTEFKGPTAPPLSEITPQSSPAIKDFKINPSICTKDCGTCPFPLNPTLSWTFDGNAQTAFQIQIADNKSFKNPIDSGKITSEQKQCGIPDGCKLQKPLSFNKEYWLRIKIWDNRNKEYGWIVYQNTYKTPAHMYPHPDFSWSPKTPQLKKEVQFTDLSKAYGGADGKTELKDAISSWQWIFQDGNPGESSEQNPKIIFKEPAGIKAVNLLVIDKDGFFCDVAKNVSAIVPLPKYKEGISL